MKTPEQYADDWMNSPALAGGYLASRQRLISMLTEAVAEAVAEERWRSLTSGTLFGRPFTEWDTLALRLQECSTRGGTLPEMFNDIWVKYRAALRTPQSAPPDLERWCADKFKEMNNRLVDLEKACAFVGYIHDIHVGDDTLIARIRALESWRDRISKP